METLTEPTKSYHPMLSYQVVKYIGAVLLVLSQLVTLNKVYSAYFGDGGFLSDALTNVLGTIGSMGLPLIMMGTCAGILRNRKRIFWYLGAYAAGAASFILIEEIAVTGYLYFVLKMSGIAIDLDVIEIVETIILGILHQFTSLNVFVDLLLVSSFCFFFFYTPKKHVKVLRWFVLLPLAYLLASYVLTVLNKFGAVSLDIYVLYLLPSKKISAYVIVLSMLLYLKLFSTDKENPNVDSRSFAVFMSFVIVFLCIIDAFLGCFPNASNFCVGSSYMLFTCIPVVLLFDYKAEIKHRWISWTLPGFYLLGYGTLLYFYTVVVLDILKKVSELAEALNGAGS